MNTTMNITTKTNRRSSTAFCLGLILAATPAVALAQQAPSVETRLNELGPEGKALAQRAGVWDVTFTSWDKPGAAPVTTTGLMAERQMIGPMLQEMLHMAPGAPGPPFTRVDDLTFNRLEGRWNYMSMDTRVPNGMMSAWSLDHDPAERVFVSFQPFATTGSGPDATGQMFRMEEIIIREDANHDRKDQYFTPASGSPTKWLAKRYSYTRRP